MDAVGVELAALEKDLAEVDSQLSDVRERLGDEVFLSKAKPALVEEQRALMNRLAERRVRIQENLALAHARRPGTLPSPQVGTWSPLALHEWTQVPDTIVEAGDEKDEVHPAPAPPERPSTGPQLPSLIAGIVLTEKRAKRGARTLHQLIPQAGKDVSTLRMLAAAFEHFGRFAAATELRGTIASLTGRPEKEPPVAAIPPPLIPNTLPPDQLPDARDGLTRMQRLVLSAMHALWFRADGPPRKTAVLLEELRLKDASITAEQVDATLAQLSLSWSRNRLVEVSGAQCRLTTLAEDLFTDLEYVDFEPGFTFKVPTVLPAPFPVLLLAGVGGVPPHAFAELLTASMHLLQFPQAPTGDLLRIVSGPDLSTGGVVHIVPYDVYATGRGFMKVSARLELWTERGSGAARFRATEFPQPIDPARAAQALRALELEGVKEIRIEVGGAVDIDLEHVVYARGVRRALQNTGIFTHAFPVELRVNRGGEAATVGLVELIRLVIEHRRDVVTRRLRHQAHGLRDRADRLEGLLVMTELLEPVLSVLREADDQSEQFWALQHLASPELKSRTRFAGLPTVEPSRLRDIAASLVARIAVEAPSFKSSHDYARGFSGPQAKEILATRRPASLSRDSLLLEWGAVARELPALEEPLRNPLALIELMQQELTELRGRHTTARRTRLA